eukprot:6181946-Pleurochrysis_carterae.AAC.4
MLQAPRRTGSTPETINLHPPCPTVPLAPLPPAEPSPPSQSEATGPAHPSSGHARRLRESHSKRSFRQKTVLAK